MLTVTFIRHGQSEDNLKTIWAGWKDAPLRNSVSSKQQRWARHSPSQTPSLISSTRLIFCAPTRQARPCSPLIRLPNRHSLLLSVFENSTSGSQKAIPNPPSSDILPSETVDELFKREIFPVSALHARDAKFPEGESLDDLARRAERVIAKCVLPHLAAGGHLHIALASHSLCISELVAALVRLDPDARRDVAYTGLFNTAWTRAVVSVKDGNPLDINHLAPLTVEITDVNNADHLEGGLKS
ncbi:phosphoglycerate mutase [Mycena latifolia]|nr:phosphoglycerate mutase [Mycena latifolia]